MFRFLFRTLFRFTRFVFRIGLLTGLGFAAVKLVQSRRGGSPLGGGAERTATLPRRADSTGRAGSEPPLVDPHMLHGVSLKRSEAPAAGDGKDDSRTATSTVAAPAPSQPVKPTVPAADVADPPAPAPARRAAAPRGVKAAKRATVKKTAARKKVAAKKAAVKKAAVKKVSAKKAAVKKAVTKKAAVKKAAVKKAAVKKATKKPARRPAPKSAAT